MIFFFSISGGMILMFLLVIIAIITQSTFVLDTLMLLSIFIGFGITIYGIIIGIKGLFTKLPFFKKILNLVYIAGISYCMIMQTGEYDIFIMSGFEKQGVLVFFEQALGGGLKYLFVAFIALCVVWTILCEFDEPEEFEGIFMIWSSATFAMIIFLVVNWFTEKKVIESLLKEFDVQKRIIVLCVLIVSYLCTLISRKRNLVKKNIRKIKRKRLAKKHFKKIEKQENKQIMYCAKCGKKLEENEKFCTACGRPVARKKQIENNSKK